MTKLKKGVVAYFGLVFLAILIIVLVYLFLKSQGIIS